MGLVKAFPVAEIVARGSIRREDVERLRTEFFHDGMIDAAGAETLIALDGACAVRDPAWSPFMVEAITDYIVDQAAPEGYLNAANAAWLLSRIAPGGRVSTKAGLEVLVRVLERARWAPVSLVACALEQVRIAVSCGSVALRPDGTARPGTITATEVDLLRRMLYAFASDGHVALTWAEARILCDIDDAIADAVPSPEWIDLYVKAMANVALTISGYDIPTRETALAQSAALEAGGSGVGLMRCQLMASTYGNVIAAYRLQSTEDRALARLERQRIEIITNEEIAGSDADWLVERLSSGQRSLATEALAVLLGREQLRLDPALEAAVSRQSIAAA